MADIIPLDQVEDDIAPTGVMPAPTEAMPNVIPLNAVEDDTPTLFSDPIGALGSKAWWTGGKGNVGQQILGPLEAAFQGINPFHEELTSAVNAGIDAWSPDVTWGQAYDQRLAQQRELARQFAADHPNWDTALRIRGALKTPIIGVAKKISSALPVAKNTIQALLRGAAVTGGLAAEGGAVGGLYGFGEGEGGATARLNRALDQAESGAKFGAALGAPLAGASEIIALNANKVNDAANAAKRMSLGVRAGDYQKGAKELQFSDIPEEMIGLDSAQVETKVKKAFDDLIEEGAFGKTSNEGKIKANVLKLSRDTAQKVNDIITDFDAKGKSVLPKFSRAKQFVNSGGVPADEAGAFLKQIDATEAAIKDRGFGSLAFLQEQKKALESKWKAAQVGEPASSGFWRAMYTDVKDAIEQAVPDVKPLNQKLQKLMIVKPVLDRGVGREESKNLIEWLFQRLRTSGARTVTAPALLAATALGGGAGLPAAVLAAIVGTAGTPAGLNAISKGVRAIAKDPGMARELGSQAVKLNAAINSLESATRRKRDDSAPLQQRKTESSTTKIVPFSKSTTSAAKSKQKTLPPEDIIDRAIEEAQGVTYEKPSEMEKLLKAVALQESSNNPNAVSSAGAIGLHQIMPATAREIANELGVKDYDLKDPETNTIFARHYLQKLLDMFGGDRELALAAYHSGPGRIRRLLKLTGGTKLSDIRGRLGPIGQKYAPGVISKLRKIEGGSTTA